MHRLLENLSDQLSDELAKNISDSVLKTVETMFGKQMLVREATEWQLALKPIAVNVMLKQGSSEAKLRLVFDRNLLSLLIAEIYSPEELRDEKFLKDAASEIANVICNKIKLFLGNNGFEVSMDLPVTVDPALEEEKEKALDLKFSLLNQSSLSDSRILHVNFI